MVIIAPVLTTIAEQLSTLVRLTDVALAIAILTGRLSINVAGIVAQWNVLGLVSLAMIRTFIMRGPAVLLPVQRAVVSLKSVHRAA